MELLFVTTLIHVEVAGLKQQLCRYATSMLLAVCAYALLANYIAMDSCFVGSKVVSLVCNILII
jgi:hypothetical protein